MIQSVDTNLFFTLVAASVTAFLGTLVFIHDRKSVSNKIFIIHSFVGTFWAVINYVSVISSTNNALIWIRLVMFLAVPYVTLFFLFVYNFPSSTLVIRIKELLFVIFLTVGLMIFSLTPLVFKSINVAMPDYEVTPVPGVLIPFFGLIIITFFIITSISIFQKYKKASGEIKYQWKSIGLGSIIAYILLIVFVFLRVILFNDTTFVPYSPIFILPIFIGMGYSILRYRLFNIKVITSEVVTFLLLLISFVQVLISESTISRIIGVVSAAFTFFLGTILIRSVLKEVNQKQKLQILSEELQSANVQLQALDKARAEFISIASHQLRTPPATIKWYVGAILNGDFGQLPEDMKAALVRVNSTNNSQISLIDDLLNASRIERGKLEFFFEMGDLNALAKTTVEQLIPQASMKKLSLVYTEPPTPIPHVMLDKEKVRQVMNNFIDNAIKYTKHGKIEVSIEQTATDVIVKVKDAGRGVPADVAPTLFHKYTRGKDSASSATGLGLGLYVAKIVIEQNNGKIWVESEGEGKGATFIFSLPIKSTLHETSTVDLIEAEPHK